MVKKVKVKEIKSNLKVKEIKSSQETSNSLEDELQTSSFSSSRARAPVLETTPQVNESQEVPTSREPTRVTSASINYSSNSQGYSGLQTENSRVVYRDPMVEAGSNTRAITPVLRSEGDFLQHTNSSNELDQVRNANLHREHEHERRYVDKEESRFNTKRKRDLF